MGLRVIKDLEEIDDESFVCVGTVVEITDKVVVVWDKGKRYEYGSDDGKDDIRVLDNAPAGSVSSQQHLTFLVSLQDNTCLFVHLFISENIKTF